MRSLFRGTSASDIKQLLPVGHVIIWLQPQTAVLSE